jgi:uncharacterized protein YoaH (UPF0181 family)
MSSNSFFNPKPKNNFVTPMKELFNSVNETIEEKSTKLPNISAKVSQLFNNNTGNKTNYKTQNPVGSANSNNTQPNSNTLNNQSVFPKQQKASDKFNELSKQAFGQNNTRATSVSSALNPFLKRDGTLVNEHIDHFIKQGLSKKEAIKAVAKERGVHKNEIYKYTLEEDN